MECTRLREGEKLVLVGVFEARAGPHPSVEPTRSTTTVIKLPLRAGCPDRGAARPRKAGCYGSTDFTVSAAVSSGSGSFQFSIVWSNQKAKKRANNADSTKNIHDAKSVTSVKRSIA